MAGNQPAHPGESRDLAQQAKHLSVKVPGFRRDERSLVERHMVEYSLISTLPIGLALALLYGFGVDETIVSWASPMPDFAMGVTAGVLSVPFGIPLGKWWIRRRYGDVS